LNDAAVIVRRTFPVRRERLFRAFTDPGELVRWFSPDGYGNPSADVDLRPGGRYRIAMQEEPGGEPFYVTGEYRVIEDPARLVFTWTWEDPAEKVRDSVVTVDFLERTEGTEVVLTHELLPAERRESHTAGWNALLTKLSSRLGAEEGGKR